MDFLSLQNFELSNRGLKLNDQEVSTVVEASVLDNLRILLQEDTVIPANNKLLVPAKVNVTSLKHTLWPSG